MKVFKFITLACCGLGVVGCTHIQDLIACQPQQKNPIMFASDHIGWDQRSVDDVRCSNAELAAVQLARKRRDAEGQVLK
jgi:hypothetical protein